MELQRGTLLQGGKYRIEQTLGRGGFGVTYLATHMALGGSVCIKEFFPQELCQRAADGSAMATISERSAETIAKFKTKFLDEARKLFYIKHPNIVGVSDLFEENSTAYYVMEYIDGESLQSKVNSSGAMAEAVAREYIKQVAAALDHVHSQQIMHLDVKPGNVMVRSKDNRAILIDFGLAKHYDTASGDATSTTPVGVSHGYAPMEQYKDGGVSSFSPSTDIYSLGATLYFLVVGKTPPSADVVGEDGIGALPSGLSRGTRSAIERAMQHRRKDRPQSIADFLALLGGKGKPVAPKTTDPKKRSKWWLWLLLLLLIAVGGFVGYMMLGNDAPELTPTSSTGGENVVDADSICEVQPSLYQVGDYYNENGKEGVVFKVWDDGRHGKIVSLDETKAPWDSRVKWDSANGYSGGTCTYADSESDGKANTDKIMSRSDSQYFDAFEWCRAKGSSWYLPAIDELKQIYNNIDKLNSTLSQYGGTALTNYRYWSSTEYVDYDPEFRALDLYMGDGDTYTYSHIKYCNFYVRAVSAF